jgi:general secretion pathway protein G
LSLRFGTAGIPLSTSRPGTVHGIHRARELGLDCLEMSWGNGVRMSGATADRIDEARVTKAKNDLRLYESALDLYRMDNYLYPTSDQRLDALVHKPADASIKNWRPEGYVKQLVKDPWNHDYLYVSPGTGGQPYDLCTLGADGQPGGEGIDADVCLRDVK